MNDFIEDIKKHHKDKRLIPFIGAGFSVPIGLPSWNELIGWIADKMEFERELFNLHGTPQQLAEYIKIKDPKLYNDFLHYMAVKFNSEERDKDRRKSALYKTLVSMEFKIIYTTNYDHHIEGAFIDAGKKINRIATLSDFVTSRTNLDCEIIKFHGTLEEPETIILTESRYFDRMALEEAVDQKLRSDILSNSFIFIGYSFNDPNIRYIWYRINKLREKSSIKQPNPRPSYFVTFGTGPVQPILLEPWDIRVINLNPVDKTNNLNEFLELINK